MLHAIGQLVPEKTILSGFTIHVYGRGGHLRGNRTIGSGEKAFKGFYNILA